MLSSVLFFNFQEGLRLGWSLESRRSQAIVFPRYISRDVASGNVQGSLGLQVNNRPTLEPQVRKYELPLESLEPQECCTAGYQSWGGCRKNAEAMQERVLLCYLR